MLQERVIYKQTERRPAVAMQNTNNATLACRLKSSGGPCDAVTVVAEFRHKRDLIDALGKVALADMISGRNIASTSSLYRDGFSTFLPETAPSCRARH